MESVCILSIREGMENKRRGNRIKAGDHMDKNEIQKIPGLIKEIEFLKKQIERADLSIKPQTVSDSVKGSSKYFPFQERTFVVTGLDLSRYDRQVQRLKRELKRRHDDLMNRIAEANEYIAGIEDSRTRMILQCRFIKGLTYEQIEAETGISVITAKRAFKAWRDFREK